MVVRAIRSRDHGIVPHAATHVMTRIAAVALLGVTVALPVSLRAQVPGAKATAPVPATHTVKRGDTLWDIAKAYLGDPFLWPEIYRLNTDQIEDPHWIRPGEVLKLPGAVSAVAAAPPQAPPPAVPPASAAPAPTALPVRVAPAPAPARPAADTTATLQPARSSVRIGEFAAAPWVDQKGGPKGSGYILQSADLTGIAPADQSRMKLYEKLLIAPPAGDQSPAKRLYVSYRLGPLIEDFGQIVIPTGIIEVTRPAQNGEAATGRVIRMFGEVLQNQRLIAYDSSAGVAPGVAQQVANGRSGKVRWLYNQPVLPSLQNYLVLDIPGTAARTGDQVELYKPRQGPVDGRDVAIPELHIADAQVLRVTPYGVTVIITAQEQPKIEEGTAARVAAKIP